MDWAPLAAWGRQGARRGERCHRPGVLSVDRRNYRAILPVGWVTPRARAIARSASGSRDGPVLGDEAHARTPVEQVVDVVRALVGDREDQLGQRHRDRLRRRREQLVVGKPGHLAGAGEDQVGVRAEAAHEPGGSGRGPDGAEQRQARRPARAGTQVEGVDGVLRHPAVGRELAADDGRHPGRRGEDRVPPRQVGRGVGARHLEQRAQAGEGADDVGARRRDGERGGDHPQQEVDLLLARHRHVGDRAGHRLVGEPDVERAVGLRQHHREARRGPRDRHHHRDARVRQRRAAQHEVGAAAGAQPDLVVEVAGPHAGRVDDRPGADGVRLAGELVTQLHAGAGGSARKRGDAGARAHVGAVGRRGAGDRDHQPRVVLELSVPGEQPAAQRLRAHRRGQAEGLGGVEAAGAREGAGAGARGAAEHVAGLEASPRHRGATARHRVVEGREHRQGVDEVRRGDLHEDAALDGALLGDRELALGEVAQAAVDQLRRPARGAEGEVVRVDGEHGETAGDGVEGNAGAGDPEADHHDVDPVGDAGQAGSDAAPSGLQGPGDEARVLRVELREADLRVGHRLRRQHEAVPGQGQRPRHQRRRRRPGSRRTPGRSRSPRP